MLENFIDVLKNKYAKFDGRASRSEFWLFWLVIIIVEVIFFVLLNLIANAAGLGVVYWIFATVLWLCLLAVLVPMLGLLVRRLHDVGKKGSWIFIALVPFAGGIWLIVLLASKPQEGANQFG